MAGQGKRFTEKYGNVFKPLIKVRGRTIIEHTLSSLNEEDLSKHNIHFVILEKHETDFKVTSQLESIFNFTFTMHYLEYATRGNLETAYLVNKKIKPAKDVLFLDSDNYYEGAGLFNLISSKQELEFAVTCCFEPLDDSCKWCFTTLNGDRVTGIYEKDKKALELGGKPMMGVFYFSQAEMFNELADKVFERQITTNNEYYLSSALSQMLIENKPVFAFKANKIIPLGTPEDIIKYAGLS